MLQWCVATAVTLLVVLIYFAYFFKFNWVKVSGDQATLCDLFSVFFAAKCSKIITWYFLKDFRSESRTQQNGGVCYTGRKNRKVGKLPPVYPNGWFALLESSQIKKGQVKHVSALSENFAVFRYVKM